MSHEHLLCLDDSLRQVGGVNVVAYRPTNVLDVTQASHFEVAVEASSKRIGARRLGQ